MEELLTIFCNLKENLLKTFIASPSLWITTRIATCYRGSIENLHILILSSKILYFVCRSNLNQILARCRGGMVSNYLFIYFMG